ncbi:DUF4240 domain-containing protein [Actinoplanes utahensis]|uniref:DUF4240 domain-containing protein n=1 Tax=Actinoplanes utahensis TaxID=1869 RepID=A0A0A6UNM7_ACTUT|nr:DUF4240 domain-containing protein [Actinoplanes utahensis]KHD77745.1 hypothetical protein MB27_09840 [Actinoplanes utahensis]GIF31342.1 hypothetical protein Aut01nite_43280 [Actinoplanes utahensis]
MTTDAPTALLPTAADEARFWALIESAWAGLGPEPAAIRLALLHRTPETGEESLYALDPWLEPFLERLRAASAGLSAQDLTDLDRVLERKLFDIDRQDIHEFTDGSDDGFLYARGFIVAAGREFYQAVQARPELAIMDAECEAMCYLFSHLHRERFGAHPRTGSGISRETCSNRAGWPS